MRLEDFEPVYIPNALYMQFVGENGERVSVRAEYYVKFLNEILRGKTMFYRFKLGEHNDEAEFVKATLPAHVFLRLTTQCQSESYGLEAWL